MEIKHFKDLNFTVVAEPKQHWVEYKVYDIEGYDSDTNTLYYHRADSDTHPDCVDTIEESEPYLSGSVKWDGCSNWHFDEQERCMLHGCCRQHLQRLGDIMAQCWDWTGQLIPDTWYGE